MKNLLSFFKRTSVKTIASETKEVFRPFLPNWSIIGKLKTEYGIEVSSIFKLHKIMEKMGLIDHIGDSWQLTEFGRVNFTGWKDRVYNPDLWHPDIVKAIADFIKNNNIDPKKITGKW